MTLNLAGRFGIFLIATVLSVGGIVFTFAMLHDGYAKNFKSPFFEIAHLWSIAWALYFAMGYFWVRTNKAPIWLCYIGTAIGVLSLLPTLLMGTLVLPAVIMAAYILQESRKVTLTTRLVT